LLVETGVASEADVRDALDEGNRTGERLGEVALRRGWISERKLTKLLAEQWGLKAPGPAKTQVDPAALARIDARLAAELGGIPFAFDQDGLVVAVAEPKTDRFEAFQTLLGNVSFAVVPPSTLTELLDTRAAMAATTSSPAERVAAWLQPPTESAPSVEETHAHESPDERSADTINSDAHSSEVVNETHTRDIPDEAPHNHDHFQEEPVSAIQELPYQETPQGAHEPTFPTAPQTGSVLEHLHALIRAIETLEHEQTETRGRLEAQQAELAELRQARATDLETINNLATELDQRRQRMDAFQTAARELAAELDR
jgi:hypothetical protein